MVDQQASFGTFDKLSMIWQPPTENMSREPNDRNIYTEIPLPTDAHHLHIRIMQLRRGHVKDPIECSLIPVKLADNIDIRFTALSYVWGERSGQHSVRVNGVEDIPLTDNLHTALIHLRKTASDIALWADAICINQEDEKEKSTQVSRMAEIYCAAEEVVAWLGGASANSDLAVKYIVDKVAQPAQPTTTRRELIEDIQTTINNPFFSSRTVWKNRLRTNDNLASTIESSLNDLWLRPYWTRVWVVQELATTNFLGPKVRKCIFRCGQNRIPFSALERFLELTLDRTWYSGTDPIIAPRRLVSLSRSIPRDASAKKVAQILWDSARLQSSDPLDRIYGIVSMLPMEYRKVLPVNYHLRLPALFANVLEAQIKLEGSLDAICSFFPLIQNQTLSEPVASFIPDYGARNPGITPFTYSCSSGRKIDASLSKKNSYTGLRTLIARGIRPATSISTTFKINDLKGHDDNFPNGILKCKWLLALEDAVFPALAQRYPEKKTQDSRFLELVLGPKQHQMVGSAYPDGRLTWRKLWEQFTYAGDISTDTDRNLAEASRQLCKHISERISGKCIFTTSDGRVGLGPEGLDKKDVICVLFGCSMCIILRFLDLGGHLLVGPAYIDGVMSGEWATGVGEEVVFRIR